MLRQMRGRANKPTARSKACCNDSTLASLKQKPLATPALRFSSLASTTGIGEAAGVANNRQRAVTQTIHLVQAAWFKPRWHQEYIGPRLDLMRQRFVVTNSHRYPVREPSPQYTQLMLKLRLATTEADKLDVMPGFEDIG